MSDFRENPARLEELRSHIRGRENNVLHFYCDHKGWVTLAVGELVDRKSDDLQLRRRAARRWLGETAVEFRHKTTNAVATEALILDDWNRARLFYPKQPGANAARYAQETLLRIVENDSRRLLDDRINRKANLLFRRRPYVEDYDPRVGMALVDVLFNAGGVAIFDMHDDEDDEFHQDIPDFWAALDPESDDLNLTRAKELFASIWDNIAGPVYQQRHELRKTMFNAGIDVAIAAAEAEPNAAIVEGYREEIAELSEQIEAIKRHLRSSRRRTPSRTGNLRKHAPMR